MTAEQRALSASDDGGATHGKPHRRSIVSLTCPYCGKFFSGDASFSGVRNVYRRHLLVHTGERPHVCAYCGAGFTTRPNLRRHIRSQHREMLTPQSAPQPAPPSLDDESTDLAAASHTTGRRTLRCRHCNRAFKLARSHTLHESCCPRRPNDVPESNCGGDAPPALQLPATRRYTCPDCELEVASAARLRLHTRYYCPFREDAFADLWRDTARCATRQAECSSEDERERRRGRELAQETGIAFYENANRSASPTSSSNSEEDDATTWVPHSDYYEHDVDDVGPRRARGRRRRMLLKRLRAREERVLAAQASCLTSDAEETDRARRATHVVRRRVAGPLQHVCPFDSCQQSFERRRAWLAHVARCHPSQYAALREAESDAVSS